MLCRYFPCLITAWYEMTSLFKTITLQTNTAFENVVYWSLKSIVTMLFLQHKELLIPDLKQLLHASKPLHLKFKLGKVYLHSFQLRAIKYLIPLQNGYSLKHYFSSLQIPYNKNPEYDPTIQWINLIKSPHFHVSFLIPIIYCLTLISQDNIFFLLM